MRKRRSAIYITTITATGGLPYGYQPLPGCKANSLALEPERFFVPPYVGHRGWLGVKLNVDPDWEEIAGIIEDAYRLVAPKTLVKKLDER